MNYIKPIGEQVLVCMDEEGKDEEAVSAGGILMPESIKRRSPIEFAFIIEVGSDVDKVSIGDKVVIPVNTGMQIYSDGVEYRIMSQLSIHAKVSTGWKSDKTQREIVLG